MPLDGMEEEASDPVSTKASPFVNQIRPSKGDQGAKKRRLGDFGGLVAVAAKACGCFSRVDPLLTQRAGIAASRDGRTGLLARSPTGHAGGCGRMIFLVAA